MKLLILMAIFGFFAAKPRAMKAEGAIVVPQAADQANPPQLKVQPLRPGKEEE